MLISDADKSMRSGEHVGPVPFMADTRSAGASAPLISDRRMVRNALWNLAGQLGPLVAAVLAVPPILEGLGTDRFGLLNLIWIVVGYFGLFDMGIGRATTKFVAEHLAKNEIDAVTHLIWTSITMLMGLGLLGSSILASLGQWIVRDLLHIPPGLHEEARNALFMLACAIPLVLGIAGARGVLEAQQRFRLINTIKVPVMIATLAAPLAVMQVTHDLLPITAALVGCRLVEFILYFIFCIISLPGLKRPRAVSSRDLKRLIGFGGWMTVSNIIGPLMTYLDRFLISGALTITAVTYYATPSDLVNRMLVIPGSFLGVVFPVMSASAVVDPGMFAALFERAMKYVLLVMTPLVLLLILFAEPGLTLWLGGEFAAHSTLVFQLLLCGMLLNSLAQVSFTAVQAAGRPDIPTKLHMIELPLYLAALWYLVSHMGIVGAAIAWLLRMAADTILLSWFACRSLPERRKNGSSFAKTLVIIAALMLAAQAAAARLDGLLLRLLSLTGVITVFIVYYRQSLMNAGD